MRHVVLWALALWVLPGLAAAEGVPTGAAAQALAGDELDLGRPEAPAGAAALDLHLDRTGLPAPGSPTAPRVLGNRAAQSAAGREPQASRRGLSFGLEVKPRGATDGLARNAEADQPGLQDNLERFMEHSTLGLRGTYRF